MKDTIAFRIDFADGDTQFCLIHSHDTEMAKKLLSQNLYGEYKIRSINEVNICDIMYEQYYDLGMLTNYVH